MTAVEKLYNSHSASTKAVQNQPALLVGRQSENRTTVP